MTTCSISSIKSMLAQFTQESPYNRLPGLNNATIYDKPLVAIAAAHDPLFSDLKSEDAVGPNHLLPTEWLSSAQSVISYFLPFTEKIRKSNRVLGLATPEWMHGRIDGEQFNNELRKHLVTQLEAANIRVLSPGLDPRFAVTNRRSNWSERHVAFIAGLGTFSLSRSLITSRGSAGRFGSVIIDFALAPTPRPYTAIDEYCSNCGACIFRCPPLAITEQGKDNDVCGSYLDRVLARFRPRYGCGKCQAGVPCEDKIPHSKPKKTN